MEVAAGSRVAVAARRAGDPIVRCTCRMPTSCLEREGGADLLTSTDGQAGAAIPADPDFVPFRMLRMPSQDFQCQVCAGASLEEVSGFDAFPRVTSDCRPFGPGGRLAFCRACGAVQKLPTPRWHEEIARVYAQYEAYHQAGGDEQIVFDAQVGRPRRRSEVLLERMLARFALPEHGRHLDVGCGSGATLRVMGGLRPAWDLHGHELGAGNLERLRSIPGFVRLHTGDLRDIDQRFDLVSMIHSLEHFEAPRRQLEMLAPCLAEGAVLLVEVCDLDRNPFDVLIVDHLMHFTASTLARLLVASGLQVREIATDWVPKELTAVASPAAAGVPAPSQDAMADGARARLAQVMDWLARFLEAAERARRGPGPFGLFGTSIAATWLTAALGDRVDFFVDEDPSRVGRRHLGREVLHPRSVSPQSTVFLALAPAVAEIVGRRLGAGGGRYVLPPSLR